MKYDKSGCPICPECGGVNHKYEKWLYGGKSDHTFYHVKATCNGCGKRMSVRRNHFTYQVTKDLFWRKTKKFIKREQKKQQSNLFDR